MTTRLIVRLTACDSQYDSANAVYSAAADFAILVPDLLPYRQAVDFMSGALVHEMVRYCANDCFVWIDRDSRKGQAQYAAA